MANTYLPSKDAELLAWSATFNTYIAINQAAVGLTIEQTVAYDAAQTDYASAYELVQDRVTRSPANIEDKNVKKRALIELTREFVNIVQANPGTTDTMRSAMGITVRDSTPTPVPVPGEPPTIDITGVSGFTIKLRLHNGDSTRRAKPNGVKGATLFSYVGEEPPTDLAAWKFEGNVTRTITSVTMPGTVEPGSKVWLTAFWFNTRAESGPATTPVFNWIGSGGVNMAA